MKSLDPPKTWMMRIWEDEDECVDTSQKELECLNLKSCSYNYGLSRNTGRMMEPPSDSVVLVTANVLLVSFGSLFQFLCFRSIFMMIKNVMN